jgi:hypothetical protein
MLQLVKRRSDSLGFTSGCLKSSEFVSEGNPSKRHELPLFYQFDFIA